MSDLKAFLRGVTVEPILFLYMLGAFISFGAFQKLLNFKVCYVEYLDHYACLKPTGEMLTYVQTQGSLWFMYCNVALYTPAILVACYLGSWGDIYGRKGPLLVSGTATLFGYVLYTYAATYIHASSLFIIIGANFVTGLGGGFIVFIASTMSYVSDISSIEARTSRVAILESMMMLGATLGPLISGFLLTGYGYAITFLFCVVCAFAVVVYVVLFLRDVSPTSKHPVDLVASVETSSSSSAKFFHFDYLYEGLVTCFKRRDGNARLHIVLLLSSCIFIFLVFAVEMDLAYLYVTDEPLSWSYLTYSIYQSVKTGSGALFLLIGLPLLRHVFNFEDTTLVFIGLASRALGLIVLAFSTTTTMMFLVPVFALFSMFPLPCYRAMLSKLVDSTEQGKMFSFVATVENLSAIFASTFYNTLYPLTRPILHGFCFLVAVGFVGIASLLTSFHLNYKRRHNAASYEDLGVQELAITANLDCPSDYA